MKDDVHLPEPQEEKKDPPPAKSRRGVTALLLAIIVILTIALVIGHFSRKGGDTEEVIPFEKLQVQKDVPSPESVFEFTWGD